MSKIEIGDRVRVVKVPKNDDDMLGLEGVVVPKDFAAVFLGFDYMVRLDDQPGRFEGTGPFNFFFEGELELVG